MWYSNLEKAIISRHILHQHWYTRPNALPVRRNRQHRSLVTVVTVTSAPPFQSLRHQRNICHPAVNRFTRQTLPTANRKYFFVNILCIESFCTQKKNAQQNAALRYYTSNAWLRFWLIKPASEHGHACLIPGLSWSWTVLLPSDTRWKSITSITTVLLPFVTYLLTLTSNLKCRCHRLAIESLR
jgi:hypothetical protein